MRRIKNRLPTKTRKIKKGFFLARNRMPTEDEINYYKRIHKGWNKTGKISWKCIVCKLRKED